MRYIAPMTTILQKRNDGNLLLTKFLFIFLLSILLLSGCKSKVVAPIPTGEDLSGGNGTNINYSDGLNDGTNDPFSEDNLPIEGTLDDNAWTGNGDAGRNNLRGSGYDGVDLDSQSESYKKLHGRCSDGFAPIYFAFDQARISPVMMGVAESNALHLQQNPSLNVRLEGNSDQRGTNEYNMALSEKRAINVRLYLENMGIDSQRIRTIAYGEERPLFTGTTEEDYQYNRRVDCIAE